MTPVDNQSRGKFRLWRAAAALRAVALDRAFNSSNDIDSLFYKAVVGRGRALRRLRAAFERDGARWTGTPNAPRWSYINPAFDLWECETRVVSLGCIWADRTTNALFNRPIWCFAASEHACGRFFQRSPPGASLSDALFEAHANVLGLSTSTLVARKRAGAPSNFTPSKNKRNPINYFDKRLGRNNGSQMIADTSYNTIPSRQTTHHDARGTNLLP
jgi:hypothetical protein